MIVLTVSPLAVNVTAKLENSGRDPVGAHEGLVAHALGLAGVADAVDAGLRLVDEVVISALPSLSISPGDRANAVAGAVEVDERVAAADVMP